MSGSTVRQLMGQLVEARRVAAIHEQEMVAASEVGDDMAVSSHMDAWLVVLEEIDELAALLAEFI